MSPGFSDCFRLNNAPQTDPCYRNTPPLYVCRLPLRRFSPINGEHLTRVKNVHFCVGVEGYRCALSVNEYQNTRLLAHFNLYVSLFAFQPGVYRCVYSRASVCLSGYGHNTSNRRFSFRRMPLREILQNVINGAYDS